MPTSIVWFRRDLRLADHPALLAAAASGNRVVPVFVLDDALLRPAGERRIAFLSSALADLRERTGGALRVLHGRPQDVLPDAVERSGATAVHVSSDHGPYGRARDAAVAEALGATPLVATGSPYGVTPGRLLSTSGTPFQVFTPYHRAWLAHGLRQPPAAPTEITWYDGTLATRDLPPQRWAGATEADATSAWDRFRETGLRGYPHEGSRLSAYLKWGLLHPRTLHAGLDAGDAAQAFARQLVWRDFYADVLWHQPQSARQDLRPVGVDYDEPGPLLTAWQQGRTGYPYVDAAMRQLREEGWMPNRARMVVASFLTKDLHLHWRHGARHFLRELVDADLASNQHGWQWVAGTGTDAAPYHRVFNPVLQGRTHDPEGSYVRRWVPELSHLPGAVIHEPWNLEEPPDGYPRRVVDHAAERAEALDRYGRARASGKESP